MNTHMLILSFIWFIATIQAFGYIMCIPTMFGLDTHEPDILILSFALVKPAFKILNFYGSQRDCYFIVMTFP